jgi:hypothetical protein
MHRWAYYCATANELATGVTAIPAANVPVANEKY